MNLFRLILTIPKKIIRKIYLTILREINEIFNPLSYRLKNLDKTYKKCGFNYDRHIYLKKLNKCLEELGLPIFDEKCGMYSEHLIIFSAISHSELNPKNILEIGTHDATTTAILSKLFPKANIKTIDLKDDDPIFINTYNRNLNFKDFIRRRSENLEKNKNITFIQANSLYLTFSDLLRGQDLIWIDGAHGYPIVASDITNCLRLLNKSGILMCDDVWKKLNRNDRIYSSTATYETISSYSDLGILDTTFFLKRIGKSFNLNYKFVSLSKFKRDFINIIN